MSPLDLIFRLGLEENFDLFESITHLKQKRQKARAFTFKLAEYHFTRDYCLCDAEKLPRSFLVSDFFPI
jgi:hypothetical protein